VAETIASVRGLDLSPRMVALATARWARPGRLEFAVDDLEHFRSPHGGFDVVVSVNTVHHGPLAPMVRCLAALVAPAGQLLIQDLVARDGWRDGPRNALAWLARWPAVHGGSRAQAALRAAYARHGAGERYCTADEARSAYRVLLPGARFKHHLAWRYSVVWRRPAP
jgi:SAM-dependent methyltransferase